MQWLNGSPDITRTQSFKIKIIQDNDSTINVIKTHVLGPFDSTKFVQLLFAKDIKLKLKKVQSN